MFSSFNRGTVKLSLKNNIALVLGTKAGRNTSELLSLFFDSYSSVKTSYAFILR